MVQQAWDHDDPMQFMKESVYYQFQRLDASYKFKIEEMDIMIKFHIYSLIFAKNQLKLNDFQSAILINLYWNQFKYDDTRFSNLNMPIWDESKLSELDEIENLDEWADENVPKQIHLNIPTEDSDELAEINVQQEKGNKTSENDMRMFKTQVKQLANWCKSNPVFEMEVFPKIIENSFTTYFNHYDLFDYLSKYPQPEEEIFLKVTIDNPQIPPALNEADYLGKIILEEERLRIEEEQKRNQEEKERADKEEQERLGNHFFLVIKKRYVAKS